MKQSPVPPRRRRWLRGVALGLSALLILILAGLYVLVSTDRGLQLIRDGIHRYGGNTLQLGSVHGRLLGNFELHDLRYVGADGTRVQLDRLRVDWTPAQLWHGLLHLQMVRLDALELDLPASQPSQSSAPFQLPQTLPVNVEVDALQLNGLDLHQTGAAPFELAGASFKGSWIGRALRIDQLNTALPQTGPLHLQAEAVMGAQRLQIKTLQLSGPGSAELAGTLGYGDTASDLTLKWNELHWPLATTESDNRKLIVSALQGQAHLSGPPSGFQYTVTAQALSGGKPMHLQLNGSGDRQGTKIRTLTLDAGKGGRAQAQGTVTWSPALQANLDLTLKQLDPDLFVPGWNGRINASAQTRTRISGGEPDTAFTLKIDHSKLRGYPLSLNAQGDSTASQATLKSLTLDAAKGHVQAQGQLAWSPQLTADLDLKLQHLDPEVFAAQFPGDINGRVELTSEKGGKTPTIHFDAALDHSTLRGKSLSLQARGLVQPQATPQPIVDLKQLALALGSTRLNASGRATPPFNLQGKLDSPDLSVFEPKLGGQLNFDFRLQGPLARPHLVSKGQGQALSYGASHVASVEWNADLDPLKPSTLKLQVKNADAGVLITQATLTASGKEKYQQITLDAQTARGDIDLQLAGGYDRKKQEWGGQIKSMKLAPARLPAWTLQNSPGLLLGRNRLSLESTCLFGESGKLCINLQKAVKQPGIKLSWSMDALRLGSFKPLLATGYKLTGQLDGQGKLSWQDSDVDSVQAKMMLKDGSLSMPDAPSLQFQTSTLTLDQQHRSLHAVLDLRAQQGLIQAEWTAAPGARLDERALSGRVKVSVPDLAFLQPLVAELQSVHGHLDGALELGGSLRQPRLNGHIDLADGSAKLRTPGISLQKVTVTLAGTGDGPLSVKGSMESGGGMLEIAGD